MNTSSFEAGGIFSCLRTGITSARSQKAGGRGQEAGGRRQEAGGRGQRAEGRRERLTTGFTLFVMCSSVSVVRSRLLVNCHELLYVLPIIKNSRLSVVGAVFINEIPYCRLRDREPFPALRNPDPRIVFNVAFAGHFIQ